MNTPTKQDVIECNDDQQLNKWVADYCEPLGLVNDYRDGNGRWLGDGSPRLHTSNRIIPYEPCSPTEKGKAQCWDLMVKHKLSVDIENGNVMTPGMAGHCHSIHDPDNWQIAVLKAAILVELGDEW